MDIKHVCDIKTFKVNHDTKKFMWLFLAEKDKMLPEKFLIKNLSVAHNDWVLKYS